MRTSFHLLAALGIGVIIGTALAAYSILALDDVAEHTLRCQLHRAKQDLATARKQVSDLQARK